MKLSVEMEVQILDEAVCILICANVLGKGMNTLVFPPDMDE